MSGEDIEAEIIRALKGPRRRMYHRAKYVSAAGVSALCFAKPRAIDMSKRVTWTLLDDAVTCPRCKKLIAARTAERPPGDRT